MELIGEPWIVSNNSQVDSGLNPVISWTKIWRTRCNFSNGTTQRTTKSISISNIDSSLSLLIYWAYYLLSTYLSGNMKTTRNERCTRQKSLPWKGHGSKRRQTYDKSLERQWVGSNNTKPLWYSNSIMIHLLVLRSGSFTEEVMPNVRLKQMCRKTKVESNISE